MRSVEEFPFGCRQTMVVRSTPAGRRGRRSRPAPYLCLMQYAPQCRPGPDAGLETEADTEGQLPGFPRVGEEPLL